MVAEPLNVASSGWMPRAENALWVAQGHRLAPRIAVVCVCAVESVRLFAYCRPSDGEGLQLLSDVFVGWGSGY